MSKLTKSQSELTSFVSRMSPLKPAAQEKCFMNARWHTKSVIALLNGNIGPMDEEALDLVYQFSRMAASNVLRARPDLCRD